MPRQVWNSSSTALASGGFVEWNEFAGNGHLYGTPTMEPPSGLDVVLEIDPQGALQVIKRYPDAVLILVGALPVRNRPGGCGSGATTTRDTSKSVWPCREEEEGLGRQMAGHVVVNDDLDRASQELAAIVDLWRQKSQ